jgi:hypothetical protein
MSRVVLSQIEDGDAVAITALNNDLTALETASTSSASTGVNELNFREEAFDERSIANRVVTPSNGLKTNESFVTLGPWTVSDGIGTTTPTQPDGATDLVIGAFNYDGTAGDTIKVRLSFDYDGETPNGTDPSIWVIDFAYSTDYDSGIPGSGTWTQIADSLRKLAFANTGTTTGHMAGSFTLQHTFNLSITSTTLYFAVRIYQEDAATTSVDFVMKYIYFYGKLRAK